LERVLSETRLLWSGREVQPRDRDLDPPAKAAPNEYQKGFLVLITVLILLTQTLDTNWFYTSKFVLKSKLHKKECPQ
jgi:hypothetical protein